MGVLYRRKIRVCTTCQQRLDTTAARERCEAAAHVIETRDAPVWWLRYRADGRLRCTSAHSTDRAVAEAMLRECEPASTPPVPAITVPEPPGSFSTAAEAILADYRMNGKRSLRTVTLRINKHLRPAFGALPLAAITTPLVRQFIARRQAEGASNATVNRDLITLKRICAVAVQDGTLDRKPFIPLLKEQNVRRGFFELEQLQVVRSHLPVAMRGIPTFAFLTGWRTPSEILPLEWRHVDWIAGEVRLDSGTTKNGEGRVFPFTTALRHLLEAQRRIAGALTSGGLSASYVFCYVSGPKAGQRFGERRYHYAWAQARVAAGCPDRIPHDLRRTAVRNLVRAGVPERVAMQLTGHKTRAVFERYNIVSPGDLRDAAARLDGFLGGRLSA